MHSISRVIHRKSAVMHSTSQVTGAEPVLARIDVGSRGVQNLIALGLAAFFVLFGALSVQKVFITADEAYHLRYGTNILSLSARRFEDRKSTRLNSSHQLISYA